MLSIIYHIYDLYPIKGKPVVISFFEDVEAENITDDNRLYYKDWVMKYMEDTREQAGEKGYVETLFGRRLYLPEINASNGMRRQAAERTAINAPMQGTAADIIKKAMVTVDAWLKESGLNARMIMQVHDELVFEVAEGDMQALCDGVVARMAEAAQLDVPLIADVGVGDNWEQAH